MLTIQPPPIPGLTYAPGFLSQDEHDACLDCVDAGEWDTTLKRRVQHYGYRYDYRSKEVGDDAPPIPIWLRVLGERMLRLNWFDRVPEQVIVNEYLPGQGIAMHTDAVWGPVVVTVSLGDTYPMRFECGPQRYEFPLLPRSALVLAFNARYAWRHGIASRRRDGMHNRGRRVSLTFRTVQR